MDGFTEDMKNRVGAALDKQAKSGQQSLMMVHLQKLQAKRDEEAAAQREIDEEVRRQLVGRRASRSTTTATTNPRTADALPRPAAIISPSPHHPITPPDPSPAPRSPHALLDGSESCVSR